MKRLVTQFDVQRTRATAATPTCCCCCCCCVGSVLTATAVATVDAAEIAGRAEVPGGQRWLYGLAAFMALPIALLAAGTAGFLVVQITEPLAFLASIGAFFGAWIGTLVAIHGRLQSPRMAKSVALTVVPCSILFGLEFFAGAALLFAGGGGGVLYLLIAAALPFVATPLLLLWIRS